MKDFFRKNGLLLLIIGVLLSLFIAITSSMAGGKADPLSNLFTTVTAPVRSAATAVMNWAEGVYTYVFRYDEMNAELEQLRQEVARLEDQVRRSTEAAQENSRLRDLLGLQAMRRDFKFESARVTQRSTSNWESTLTISKGSKAGVAAGNCVISETGALVGVVDQVGLNYARVSTIINTDVEMGGFAPRTNCAGILEGDFALMAQGKLKLSYLPDDVHLMEGDQVITSGKGEVYPSGLVAGVVEEVCTDPTGMMRYAVVEPAVDLSDLIEVFIIKEFEIVE